MSRTKRRARKPMLPLYVLEGTDDASPTGDAIWSAFLVPSADDDGQMAVYFVPEADLMAVGEALSLLGISEEVIGQVAATHPNVEHMICCQTRMTWHSIMRVAETESPSTA